mmetsp:Transcript_76968/g.218112  ORF Transcript_76968/g.218112 Transcript_76968/m.218112 type:complete len:244 (+) Transcript_76968:2566-3297(+)
MATSLRGEAHEVVLLHRPQIHLLQAALKDTRHFIAVPVIRLQEDLAAALVQNDLRAVVNRRHFRRNVLRSGVLAAIALTVRLVLHVAVGVVLHVGVCVGAVRVGGGLLHQGHLVLDVWQLLLLEVLGRDQALGVQEHRVAEVCAVRQPPPHHPPGARTSLLPPRRGADDLQDVEVRVRLARICLGHLDDDSLVALGPLAVAEELLQGHPPAQGAARVLDHVPVDADGARAPQDHLHLDVGGAP